MCMKWNKARVFLAASAVTLGLSLAPGMAQGAVMTGDYQSNSAMNMNQVMDTQAMGAASVDHTMLGNSMPMSKAPYNEQVFTTIEGQSVTLPAGIKTRDLKHVAFSKGYVDGQGEFHRTETLTGNALAVGITPADYNELLNSQIRSIASAEKLNVPELQNFNAPVWRDWNVHQWTKVDAKGWHSAYVVELALSSQYLEFGNAMRILNEKGKAQATPDKPFNLQAALMEETQARIESQISNTTEVRKPVNDRENVKMHDLMSNMQTLNSYWTDKLEADLDKLDADLKEYGDTTYSPEREYARLQKQFADKTYPRTIESINKEVRDYKAKLLVALGKDLALDEIYLGPKKVRPYKVVAEREAQTNAILKFMMNSNLIVDDVTDRLVTTKFGKGQYSELRAGMVIDGFEVPVTIFRLAYYTELGPVMNTIVVNDSDYDTWKPVINDVWGIQ